MKRWAGLLLVLVVATIGVVIIATRLQPSDLERRHATIRLGMTSEEVVKIMDTGGPEPLTFLSPSGAGFIWEYRPPKRSPSGDVRFEVYFDPNARVIRTTVDGVQVQPPFKWGNP